MTNRQIASAIVNARDNEAECKQAQEVLNESQRVFSTLMSNLPGMAYRCLIDENYTFEFASEGCLELTGYHPTDFYQGGTIAYADIIHPDDRERIRNEATASLLERRERLTVTYRIITANGDERWLWDRAIGIYSAEGDLIALEGFATDITEQQAALRDRKRTEDALRRYERIVSATPDGMALLDRDYIYQVVNQTYLDWNVKRYDDIVGHSVDELLGEELFQTVVKPCLDRCLAGELIRFQSWFNYADGHKRFVGITYAPYVEMNGTISGVVVTGRDLTELKRAEVALSQSQETIQRQLAEIETIYATAPIGLCFVDTNLRFVRINEHLAEINGLPVAAHIGHTIREVLPELADELEPTYLQVIQSGNPSLDRELHVTTPTQPGIEGDWLISYYPLKDNCDRILGVNVVVQEITERKQAEQKIREQAALLNVATDAIFVRDLDSRILFWNNSAEQLYGWKSAEVLGRNVNELLYSVGNSLVQLEDIQKTLLTAGEWQGELHQVTRYGKSITVESRWTLVHDRENRAQSILVVNTDITEKKQLEAQFYRAQRLESIGTLASGIAHDLNNILSPILISSQLLQTRISDASNQKLLKTMETNAKRGAAIIKQVLSFARGVEGERKILQVRHLISEIKHIIEETFPKSIEFYTKIASDLWPVSGDVTQLHQMLLNLCVNARDAMPDGGTLRISAANLFIDRNYTRMNLEARLGPYIAITVADTGIGIPPEILDRIFEPFFTTKQQSKGTGLGLSSVMGIIKSHGGFVKVSSNVGQGTQFQVFLPAVEALETPQVENPELPRGNGELILIVDDEASIIEISKTSLETYNYRALAARNGLDAIALYAKHQTELSVVLIDMMMPYMDGLTLIRQLQQMNPQVNIITMSGLLSNEKLGEAVGVKAFLSKPFTIKELLNTIQAILIAS